MLNYFYCSLTQFSLHSLQSSWGITLVKGKNFENYLIIKDFPLFSLHLFLLRFRKYEVDNHADGRTNDYFANPFFFFILLPTKFQEGIFFRVLLTGCTSQSRKMISTAMPMRQVMP